jgi:phage N-6-adenine-methyltransferase
MAPIQKPGRSKQDYQTPAVLIKAVLKRLAVDRFAIDLAADATNAQAAYWWDEEKDSLKQCWRGMNGWCWLNPPFAQINPWVKKAWEESRAEVVCPAKIAMLVPAGVGANWWRNWVDGKAHVLFLNGRLTFTGETAPYPKDCALLLYTSYITGGYEVWDWRH